MITSRMIHNRAEMTAMLKKCPFMAVIYPPNTEPDPASLRLVIDNTDPDQPPPLADVVEAVMDHITAGRSVLYATRGEIRIQFMSIVAQEVGWSIGLVDADPSATRH